MTDGVVTCPCSYEKEVTFNDIGEVFVCEECGYEGIIEVDEVDNDVDGGYYFWINNDRRIHE